MEFQGHPARPTWVGMCGVPVQVWNEEVFQLLGNCINWNFFVDSQTEQRKNLEVGRVKVFLNKSGSLPLIVPLWVEDLMFFVEIREEDGANQVLEAVAGSCSGNNLFLGMSMLVGLQVWRRRRTG